MASNPPFQVEDQTDEDFFDRLVNDDDFGSTVISPGSDSDETKAFADLNIGNKGGEDGTGPNREQNSLGGRPDESKNLDAQLKEKNKSLGAQLEENKNLVALQGEINFMGAKPEDCKNVDNQPEESNNLSAELEESNNMVLPNSFGFDNIIDSSENGIGSTVASDLLVSKSSGSGGLGVKEVGWNAFHADSEQKGTNGFGSYSDFFSTFEDNSGDSPLEVNEDLTGKSKIVSSNEEHKANGWDNVQYQEGQEAGASSTEGQDLNSSQYWENLYPGWAYDANTGQWYQIDGYDATLNTQASLDANSSSDCAAVADGGQEVSYFQQTTQSVVGTLSESGTSETVSNWNQVSQVNNGYPEHMVFDPQYPGWYYNTVAQEWCSLESYTQSVQSTFQANGHQNHNEFTTADTSSFNSSNRHGEYGQTDNYVLQDLAGQAQYGGYGQNNNYGSHILGAHTQFGEYGQTNNYGQNLEGHGKIGSWAQSYSNNNQQSLKMWQPETITTSKAASEFGATQQLNHSYGSANHVNHQEHATGAVASNSHQEANGHVALTSFVPDGTFNETFNQGKMQQNEQMDFSKDHFGSQNPANDYYNSQKQVNDYHGSQNQLNDYYGTQKQVSDYYSNQKPDIPQQSHQSGHKFSYSPNVGISSAGRPPHALVTFGFGGKLIVMRENNSLVNSSRGNQDPAGGSISVHNLMEVVTQNTDASTLGDSASGYFRALCQQPFSSPLVGGNVGGKELNKWIDERITTCESLGIDYRKCEILKLLLSLLKTAYQHYGKLRSPFNSDTALRETDLPETAIAKLFANAKRNRSQFNEYGALSHCLKNLPSEGQIHATASEVQNLLVSGSKIEALQCAQEGQLWGPALVLASQLGDQFYIDTVKQMALQQMVAGSPLRTLCLLIAGQPADVFAADPSNSSFPGSITVPQQPAQFGTNSMLDDWEENLAVITANRTKSDELVLLHLGDCLWKERSEIFAAHICYLVAEANFESYSDSARLCLIGADHWKSPRTYASPDAIQRTEFFEYSKVLGNSQFILLPFQPYKIIYAHMLAEVGKISESLKYCQAVLKSLKTSRAPEVETWKQLVVSLEERIKAHQQGGYTANLAPAKLVGKLLNFFDSTAHRVVGGLPPGPSTTQGSVQGGEQYHHSMTPRVSTSQSTMAMSSLVPSASMEPINGWTADGNMKAIQNRSVSEPDFGRSKVNSSKEATSSHEQSKASGTSRFARFGFGSQILQKTVGLVLRPRSDKQAKLGGSNKFYYDEKLKRWVEEGVEPPAEEAALPPPPTTASFKNEMLDYNLNHALKSEGSPPNRSPRFKSPVSEHSSGIPPIPPSSNQFSARARMGVRSRYVDTFNQGGGTATNVFQSPSVPSVKPVVAANAKFFIPAAVPAEEQTMGAVDESKQEDTPTTEPSASIMNDPFQLPVPLPSMTMHRFPSMDNIQNNGEVANRNGSLSSHSRRTSSWSGSLNEQFSPPKPTEAKPLGQMLGMPGSSTPSNPSMMHMPTRGSFGDDLQEVEL